jgi:hypothetical protein
MNRMVTKGYQKGVYERVTKGISAGVPQRRNNTRLEVVGAVGFAVAGVAVAQFENCTAAGTSGERFH